MKTNHPIRIIWFAAGMLSLGCAIAGAVLPILPTTPFLLVSVFAFAKSSPRMHQWLINHAQFGPLIQNWQDYGAIDRRTKYISLIVMALTPVVSWMIGATFLVLILQAVVLILAASFIITRPDAKPARKKILRKNHHMQKKSD